MINVNANTSSFYEAEFIDNIYLSKYLYSNNTIYYQKARVFRESNTNEIAYCIEPFRFFNDYSEYNSSTNINNISPEKLDTIKRLAYYGYGYDNHYEMKWYAITQYLIWQETVENGEVFFTDTLNGKKIYPFQSEINELYNLVYLSRIKPSFIDKTHYIVEGNNLVLDDKNNVLNQYNTNTNQIKNNQLHLNNLKKGSHQIKLSKEYNRYNQPILFYQSPNSQNLIKIGNLDNEELNLEIQVINTNIQINKIDSENKNIFPQGDSSLNNAIFSLYDEKMNLINEYKVINNKINIENLNFGKYYLKETKPGTGYNINQTTYEINITEDNYNHSLTIENQVIKKKITIQKRYGENNNLNNESNIEFEIYNKDDRLINTIKTNDQGFAEITLPYGKYKIKQLNTTTGYQKIEPFFIEIKDNIEETIELTDYKIPIPNTSKNKLDIIKILKSILINLLCI